MDHPWDYSKKLHNRRWLDPRKALLASTRSTARLKNLEHTLSLSDIKIPSHCPILGMPLRKKGQKNDSMSVDRINPLVGYVPENIMVISMRANRIKSDASLEELEKIVEYIRNNTCIG